MATQGDKRQFLLLPVAFLIMGVWTATVGYGMLEKDWVPFSLTTPLMVALGAYVFGFKTMSNILNGGKE